MNVYFGEDGHICSCLVKAVGAVPAVVWIEAEHSVHTNGQPIDVYLFRDARQVCLVSLHVVTLLWHAQAEEERKRAEAEAAAKEAAELAANPVLRLRKLISCGATPSDVAAELKTIDVQGGHVGRMRVLYEVTHAS